MPNGCNGWVAFPDRFIEHAGSTLQLGERALLLFPPGKTLAGLDLKRLSPEVTGLRSIATDEGSTGSTDAVARNDFQNRWLGQRCSEFCLRTLCRPDLVGPSCRVGFERVGDRVLWCRTDLG